MPTTDVLSGAPAERSDVIGTSQTAASHRGQPRRYASTADTRRSLPGSRSSLAKMLPTCLRTAASLTKKPLRDRAVRQALSHQAERNLFEQTLRNTPLTHP